MGLPADEGLADLNVVQVDEGSGTVSVYPWCFPADGSLVADLQKVLAQDHGTLDRLCMRIAVEGPRPPRTPMSAQELLDLVFDSVEFIEFEGDRTSADLYTQASEADALLRDDGTDVTWAVHWAWTHHDPELLDLSEKLSVTFTVSRHDLRVGRDAEPMFQNFMASLKALMAEQGWADGFGFRPDPPSTDVQAALNGVLALMQAAGDSPNGTSAIAALAQQMSLDTVVPEAPRTKSAFRL